MKIVISSFTEVTNTEFLEIQNEIISGLRCSLANACSIALEDMGEQCDSIKWALIIQNYLWKRGHSLVDCIIQEGTAGEKYLMEKLDVLRGTVRLAAVRLKSTMKDRPDSEIGNIRFDLEHSL